MSRLAHLYLPDFPLQRWALERPSSKSGEPIPVVMIHEERGLRRVAFASPQARAWNVSRGMTATAASALVPELLKLPLQPEADHAALLALGESLLRLSPLFQLDLSEGIWLSPEAAHLFGGEQAWLERVVEAVEGQGYRCSIALARGARVARLLARVTGSKRSLWIQPGQEREGLANLPMSVLAEEAAPEAVDFVERCRKLGLRSLSQLAELSRPSVQARFGAVGLSLHRLACGEDEMPLVPTCPAEKLEAAMRFDWAAESIEPVLFSLKALFDRLCQRLRGRRRAAVRLTVTFELDPRGEHALSIALARPTSDGRLLLELARLQLEGMALAHAIAGVAVTVDETCESPELQLELPDENGSPGQGDAALEILISRLATTLGSEALGTLELPESHRPEAASRLKAFRPQVSPRSMSGGRTLSAFARERPARLLPLPERLEVRLGPARELLMVRLAGQDRPVQSVAGPEKLRGDWWCATSYGRDYYRVLCAGIGPVWLFEDLRDRRFYLHGYFD